MAIFPLERFPIIWLCNTLLFKSETPINLQMYFFQCFENVSTTALAC